MPQENGYFIYELILNAYFQMSQHLRLSLLLSFREMSGTMGLMEL